MRTAKLLDDIAHFLYCPAILGRRIAVHRWYHDIHLIPGSVLARACDRYDRWPGARRRHEAP